MYKGKSKIQELETINVRLISLTGQTVRQITLPAVTISPMDSNKFVVGLPAGIEYQGATYLLPCEPEYKQGNTYIYRHAHVIKL